MTQQVMAHWRGSEKTADQVREEIARRYGEEEAEEYDPHTNCFTLPTWNKLGFKVRKGEKAIILFQELDDMFVLTASTHQG